MAGNGVIFWYPCVFVCEVDLGPLTQRRKGEGEEEGAKATNSPVIRSFPQESE